MFWPFTFKWIELILKCDFKLVQYLVDNQDVKNQSLLELIIADDDDEKQICWNIFPVIWYWSCY